MEQSDGATLSINEFEALFLKHYKFLCLVANQLTGDLEVSKDLVQEFYIDFWRRRETLRLSGPFQSYATRAVKNLCITHLRKQATAETRQQNLELEESFDPQLEAEEQFDREMLDIKLRASIDKLPKECRNIFMLHNFEGLTYAQIAERNQISINTVKTQIKRAYAFLRSELPNQPWVFIYFIFLCSRNL